MTKAKQVELVAKILMAKFHALPMTNAIDIALEIVRELEKNGA